VMNQYLSRRIIKLVVGTIVFAACEGITTPDEIPTRPDVTASVTAELQRQLDRNGNFVLQPPATVGSRPLVGPDEAGQIASELLRQFLVEADTTSIFPGAISGRLTVERQHGMEIDWPSAEVGVPEFAWSSLGPLPEGVPGASLNFWGPHFLVPIVTGNTQVGLIALAAHAAGVSLTEAGTIEFRGDSGNLFLVAGVPYFASHLEPLSPEAAVVEVWSNFGQRIDRVPRLLQPGSRITPLFARWEVHLERPISGILASTGKMIESRTIFVGLRPSLNDLESSGPSFKLRFFWADSIQPERETEFGWPYVAPVRLLRVLPLSQGGGQP
jgi:hypothetical protein